MIPERERFLIGQELRRRHEEAARERAARNAARPASDEGRRTTDEGRAWHVVGLSSLVSGLKARRTSGRQN